MLKQFEKPIKVDSKIKLQKRSERIASELKVGDAYYVSFGTNWTYPCLISEIENEFEQTEVKIKKRVKKDLAYFIGDGQRTYDPHEERVVYVNEIGKTPVQAVQNSV